MDSLEGLGREIVDVLRPTFTTYIDIHKARKQEILANPSTEHAYGPHPRQKLDLYLPINSSNSKSKLPCVVFLIGGGFVQGNKIVPGSDGTIHANVGNFFEQRGFVTAIPDYRLYGSHDAAYPSGGEDVALVLKWVVKNVSEVDPDAIFLVGISAGGAHAATYLWSDELSDSIVRTPIKAVILISVPMHLRNLKGFPTAGAEGYYDKEKIESRCPLALRKASRDQTETLLMVSDRDPEMDILEPNRDFRKLFPLEGVRTPEQLDIKGHNHIAIPFGLGLGGKEGAWGEELVEWMRSRVTVTTQP